MPPLENDAGWLVQDVVVWTPNGQTRYDELLVNGRRGFKVRWLNKYKVVIDAHGNTIATDAQMVAPVSIPSLSIVWPGKVADLPPSGTPPGGLYQVITSNDTPDIKGRNYRHETSLMRYKDALPTLA